MRDDSNGAEPRAWVATCRSSVVPDINAPVRGYVYSGAAVVDVVVVVAAEDVGGVLGDADWDAALAWAIAFSSAAMVAASTVPVGLTPSSVWKDFQCLGQLRGPVPVDRSVPEPGEVQCLLNRGRRGERLLGGGPTLRQ